MTTAIVLSGRGSLGADPDGPPGSGGACALAAAVQASPCSSNNAS